MLKEKANELPRRKPRGIKPVRSANQFVECWNTCIPTLGSLLRENKALTALGTIIFNLPKQHINTLKIRGNSFENY